MNRRDRRRTGPGIAGSLLAAFALAAGCTVAGHPASDHPDSSSLATGLYHTQPIHAPAGDLRSGRILESARLAETLIDPARIDPALRQPLVGGAVLALLPRPVIATTVLAPAVSPALEGNSMIAGAVAQRSEVARTSTMNPTGTRTLSVIVLRFPDPSAADRAASGIDSDDAAVSTDNELVQIPGWPAAHAHRRPGVPSLAATIAHGDYVVSLLIGAPTPDLPTLTALARLTFGAQLPRLDFFTATPPEKLPDLPLDPTGLVSRLVPAAPDRWPYPTADPRADSDDADFSGSHEFLAGIGFGPHAAQLQISTNARFVDTAVEAYAVDGDDKIARFPDAAAARQHSGEMGNQGPRSTPIDPPAGLSGVTCWADPGLGYLETQYNCLVVVGRYVAYVTSRDKDDLIQRAAAQFGLLETA